MGSAVQSQPDGGQVIFDMRTYGAKLDGVSDDLAALQAADAAAAEVKGIVYIPAGIAAVSSNFSPSSDVTVQGAGRRASFLKALGPWNTEGGIINIASAGVTIRDLGFIGNNQSYGAITMAGAHDSLVEDCWIDAGSQWGMFIGGNSTHNTINRVTIDGTSLTHGIEINNSSYNTVAFSHIRNAGANGIELYLDSTSPNTIGNRLVKNIIEDSTHSGIALGGDRETHIEGNTIKGSRVYGLYTTARVIAGNKYPVTGANITGNTFIDNGIATTQTGVNFDEPTVNVTFTANTVKGSGLSGVRVYGAANTIQGNTIYENGREGIHVIGARNTVVGNIVTNNSTSGAGNSSGIVIEGNYNNVASNTSTDTREVKLQYHGISVTGSNNTIGNNSLTGNLNAPLSDTGLGNVSLDGSKNLTLVNGLSLATDKFNEGKSLNFRNSSGTADAYRVYFTGSAVTHRMYGDASSLAFQLPDGSAALTLLSSGAFGVGTASPLGRLHVVPTSPSAIGVLISGRTGQTGSQLAVLKDDATFGSSLMGNRLRLFNVGDSVFGTENGGNFERMTIAPVANVYTFMSEAGGAGAVRDFAFTGGKVGIGSFSGIGARLHVKGSSPSTPLIIAQTVTGQTANAFEVRSNHNTLLAGINQAGGFIFPDGTIQTTAAVGGVVSFNSRTGAVVPQSNDYTWAQINKNESSLADLTVRSASDLTSGILPDGRFPLTLPAVSGLNLTQLNADRLASGIIPAARFPGILPAVSGANLTNLNANNITSGVISIEAGGTGQATSPAAFDALSPAAQKGDLISHDGATNVRVPAGSDGQVLVADSTRAAGLKWADQDGGTTYAGSDDISVNGSTIGRATAAGPEAYFILGSHLGGAVSQSSILPNTVYAYRQYIPVKMAITSLSIELLTGAEGASVSVGIFSADGSTRYVYSGLILAGTAGIKSAPVSYTISPGWYWVAITSDAAITLRAFDNVALSGLVNATTPQRVTGSDSVGGALNTSLGVTTASSATGSFVVKIQGQ